MSGNRPDPWILAAYYWSPYLACAVLDGQRIVELTCHRLSRRKQGAADLSPHFQALAQDYAPDRIVIPPVTALYEAGMLTGYSVETISMTTAKEMLLGRDERHTHRDLFAELVRRYPQLKPYIPNLTGGRGDVAAVRSRRAVQLLPVALGLAATSPR